MSYVSDQQYRCSAKDATTATFVPATPGSGSAGQVPTQIVVTWAATPVEFIVGAIYPRIFVEAS